VSGIDEVTSAMWTFSPTGENHVNRSSSPRLLQHEKKFLYPP
jgi:hypothetical protein